MASLTVAAIGGATTVAAVLAQAAGGGQVDVIAPFVQAGGTVSAVGALVYTVRQLVNGNLVARPVAEVQTEMAALVHASFKREEQLATIHADAGKREDALSLMLDRTASQLGRASVVLERLEG